jgi:hypothetical protein
MSMLPDLQASLLCEDVRQERNGKFIFIGLFDSITAVQYPVIVPRLFVVTRWCGGEGKFHQQTRLVHPDQKTVVIQGQAIPVKLHGQYVMATSIELFINVSFQIAGIYWVEVLLENDLKIRYPLRIMPPQPFNKQQIKEEGREPSP